MFTDICRRYNVTTVLITPILNYTTIKVLHKPSQTKFPFLLLAADHGLINSYVGIREGDKLKYHPEEGRIFMLFETEKVMDIFVSDIQTLSLNMHELIMSSTQFEGIYLSNNEYIVYQLQIPEGFEEDLEFIRSSKYSKVSPRFKDTIAVKQARIPVREHTLAVDMVSSNFAWHVIDCGEEMREIIYEDLGSKPDLGKEMFKKFSYEKEILDIDTVKDIANLLKF